MGINSALNFSLAHQLIKKTEYISIAKHIHDMKLPSSINNYFSYKDLNKILSFMMIDKKNNSKKINLILLKQIGKAIFDKQYANTIIKKFLKKELSN